MRANAFLPRGFGDGADRHARVQAAAARRVDAALLSELRAQDEPLARPARRANLDRAAQPRAVVVATGQQVGLFLGRSTPSTRRRAPSPIARALSAETGARCVPLFWLQTEDHDFAEIPPSRVPRDGEGRRCGFSLSDAPGQERVSLAHRRARPEVGPLLDALDDALADQPHRAEVVGLLRERYRPGVPIGRAFAEVLRTLFAADGLGRRRPSPAVARAACSRR